MCGNAAQARSSVLAGIGSVPYVISRSAGLPGGADDIGAWTEPSGIASLVFETVDRGRPIVVEDAARHDLINPAYAPTFGVRSLLILPLLGSEDQPLGAVISGSAAMMRN